jgi:hypothetical protein
VEWYVHPLLAIHLAMVGRRLMDSWTCVDVSEGIIYRIQRRMWIRVVVL